ncbi:response regulator [Halobacillus salinarum]|uniref:Response regulator n=1 Tax=Halobacillus salinarum TaxID=2932257 RepID=A0ABY4EK97_9BACI|nr:response regulator [Halobacillus salinarum]UOQ44054.1 response regulator [Halobacillus salinarum]
MKILIVDDEQAIHKQLTDELPWLEAGWELAGHAYNGEEASSLVEEMHPDIIITDIKMPLKNGLEFMEHLKTFSFKGKVIVLSGYGDFQYSRPAFLLDAFEYLLKPVKVAEMVNILSRAEDEIRKQSQDFVEHIQEQKTLNKGLVLMQDEFLSEIVLGSIKDENEIIVRGEELYINFTESSYSLIVMKLINFDQVVEQNYSGDRYSCYYAIRNIIRECLDHTEGISFRYLKNSNEFIFVYPSETNHKMKIEKIISSLFHAFSTYLSLVAYCGISRIKNKLDSIPIAYQESNAAINNIKIYLNNQLMWYNTDLLDKNTEVLEEWKEIHHLFDCLVKERPLYSKHELISKLNGVMGETYLSETDGNHLRKAIHPLINTLQQSSNHSLDFSILINKLEVFLTELKIEEVRQLLISIVYRLLEYNKDGAHAYGKNLIEMTKKYVEDNYSTVNLEVISDKFYVNKNYYCSLFKKVTGENFSTYLKDVRMNKAMKLLVNSDLKTYEISEIVGYRDQRYFSQVFKKYVGIKPTQYRVKHR